jgi:hypothetical protein
VNEQHSLNSGALAKVEPGAGLWCQHELGALLPALVTVHRRGEGIVIFSLSERLFIASGGAAFFTFDRKVRAYVFVRCGDDSLAFLAQRMYAAHRADCLRRRKYRGSVDDLRLNVAIGEGMRGWFERIAEGLRINPEQRIPHVRVREPISLDEDFRELFLRLFAAPESR